jgi:Tol biopolymer transport system component
MHKLRLCLIAAGLVTTGTALVTSATPSQASAACTIAQITDTSGGTNWAPAISGDGNVLAFESDRTFAGAANADGNQEIVRYDVGAGTFSSVTETVGGSNGNQDPTVDEDGSRIAYASDRNPTGDNLDGSREIFLWVRGQLINVTNQVTNTPAGRRSIEPQINEAGDRIVFGTNGNLTGNNADGGYEIHLARTNALPALTQVTDSPNVDDSGQAVIDAAGDTIAFGSAADIVGRNADGNAEIYTYEAATGNVTQQTRTTTGRNTTPALSDDGRRIAFISDSPMNGRNADGSTELALRDTVGGTITPMAPFVAGSSEYTRGAVISGNGRRLAALSEADLTGTDPTGGSELFTRDLGGPAPRLTRLTDGPDAAPGVNRAAIDDAGTHLVFNAFTDLTGDNSDGNSEIFLATCNAPPAPAMCDGQLVTADRVAGEATSTAKDVIRGTNGPDSVNGKGGPDRFCGRGGNDTFNGGAGADRAFGGGGNDRLRGDAGNDLLDGGPGADRLSGGANRDTCRGAAGTDTGVSCEVRLGLP